MRASGILMPVSSLPSPHGIGCFSKEAYEFADQLAAAGQRYWQILPLGPTGYGDSPYQSFSAFAGNPYFIDPDELIRMELLTKEEVMRADPSSEGTVEYGWLYKHRYELLRKAFDRFDPLNAGDYGRFVRSNRGWLEDYALFMTLKNANGGSPWYTWSERDRSRDEKILESNRDKYRVEIAFQIFLQYMFSLQWEKLKAYVNGLGIKIIGDIPIYVAFDGAECWSEPGLFCFGEDGMPSAVAGCPPDAFAPGGQVWGNPLYDWDKHRAEDFAWWKRRIGRCLEMYDVIRVDHFRGFDEFFSVPYQDETAANGHWEKGPGMDLFNALADEFGQVPIIAEDLGYVTDSVKKLVADSGYPGMKLIEFAFDSREPGDYMPYGYTKDTVVYTGTHDNEPLRSWYDQLTEEDRSFLDEYLDLEGKSIEQKVWALIRLALQSVSDTCVIPMQDYLCLGSEGRMNTPSTMGKNWQWRMKKGAFDEALVQKIRRMCELAGRVVN